MHLPMCVLERSSSMISYRGVRSLLALRKEATVLGDVRSHGKADKPGFTGRITFHIILERIHFFLFRNYAKDPNAQAE